MKGGVWQLTWTGLLAGSPGEAVQPAWVMDDLKVVIIKSLEPPGELSLRLLHSLIHRRLQGR